MGFYTFWIRLESVFVYFTRLWFQLAIFEMNLLEWGNESRFQTSFECSLEIQIKGSINRNKAYFKCYKYVNET